MFYFIGLLGLIQQLMNQYPLDRWNPYIKNVDKIRYYGWYLMRYILAWTWLLPAYITLQPFSIQLIYEFEKSIYIYDLVNLIYHLDWMYSAHHIITIWMLLRSQTDVIYPYGIKILYMMNMTAIPFYLARLSRHLTFGWVKQADTLFLTTFGYFRVWKFTQFFWNYYTLTFLPKDILCMGILLYILQWVWFIGLAYRYKMNYLSVKKHTIKSYLSYRPRWNIKRTFQPLFFKTIRQLKWDESLL